MQNTNPRTPLRLLILLALVLAPLPAARAAETWQGMFKDGSNNALSKQAATVTGLTTGSQTWTTPNDGLFANAGIVIGGGAFYAVKQDGSFTTPTTDDSVTLMAYKAESGRFLWKSKPLEAGLAVSYWSSSTPTVDPASGTIYLGIGSSVYNFNPANGAVISSVTLTAANTHNIASSYEIINSSPSIGAGKIFIETYGGFLGLDKQLVALNQNDLSVAWAVLDGGLGNGIPCFIDSGTSQTVCSAGLRDVSCYDARTGRLIWRSSALAIQDKIIGDPSWTMPNNIAASLVYSSGSLYVTSEAYGANAPGAILSVNAATGVKNWATPKTIGWVSVPPVVMGSKVYVKGGDSHTIWCLNATDGSEIFKKDLGGGSFASFGNSMAATNDRIYTTDGTRLMILDPASGNVLASLADGAATWNYYSGAIAIDARGGVYTHFGNTVRAFGQTVPVTFSAFSAE